MGVVRVVFLVARELTPKLNWFQLWCPYLLLQILECLHRPAFLPPQPSPLQFSAPCRPHSLPHVLIPAQPMRHCDEATKFETGLFGRSLPGLCQLASYISGCHQLFPPEPTLLHKISYPWWRQRNNSAWKSKATLQLDEFQMHEYVRLKFCKNEERICVRGNGRRNSAMRRTIYSGWNWWIPAEFRR